MSNLALVEACSTNYLLMVLYCFILRCVIGPIRRDYGLRTRDKPTDERHGTAYVSVSACKLEVKYSGTKRVT